MKYGRYILLIASLVTTIATHAANPGFYHRGYSLSGAVEYSYNRSWAHHANFDIHAFLPIHPHFEMEANIALSTANVYTGAVALRPKFALPVGELFLETDLMCRAVARNRITDFTAALALGYRMDYISITAGVFGRVMDNWDRSWHSTETFVTEPFNLLYRIEVFCRPQANPWNISFCIANIDDHHMERMTQPLFMAGAYYMINDHWRLNLSAQCKPTGMFHLDATFYGASFRTGCTYIFGSK